jgi:hypothetical protein
MAAVFKMAAKLFQQYAFLTSIHDQKHMCQENNDQTLPAIPEKSLILYI